METEKITSHHKRTICFVAGNSGGHILPGLTYAQTIRERDNSSIIFFSTMKPLDMKLLYKNPLITRHIPFNIDAVPTQKLSFAMIRFLYATVRIFFESLIYLTYYRPKKIISTGGYISIPVCYAGALLRIPIELFELNVEPGKAVRFLSPLAQTIKICFPATSSYLPKAPCVVTDYPLRFSRTERALSTTDARTSLNLLPHRKTIFFIGGSQGSAFLNWLAQTWLEKLPNQLAVQVLHQTGDASTYDWQALYEKKGIPASVFTFVPNLAPYYAAADVVVCRAGAGTLFETVSFNKKSIVIPLITPTTSHQKDNAYALRKQYPDQIYIIDQATIEQTPDLFFKTLQSCLQ